MVFEYYVRMTPQPTPKASLRDQLVKALRACMKDGLYGNTGINGELDIIDENGTAISCSSGQLDSAVTALTEPNHTAASILLALGEYRGKTTYDRHKAYARLVNPQLPEWNQVRRTKVNLTLGVVADEYLKRYGTKPSSLSYDYVTQYLECTIICPDAYGKTYIVNEQRTIRALKDGVTEYRQPYKVRYKNGVKAADERITVINLEHGTYRIEESYITNQGKDRICDVIINPDHPLTAGETYTFVIQNTSTFIKPKQGSPTDQHAINPHQPIEKARIIANFSPIFGLPKAIWKVAELNDSDRVYTEFKQDREPVEVTNNLAVVEWQNLAISKSYVLRWLW